MKNLLLNIPTLPNFGEVKADDITPFVDMCLTQGRQVLAERLQQTAFTWDNLILPLNTTNNQLEKGWSVVGHLNGVANTEALRDAYNANLGKLSDYHTEMGQNKAFFEAIQAIRKNDSSLDNAQKKSLDDSLLSFKLSGVALAEAQKQRFREVSQELSQLTSKFSDNVLDATQAWIKQVTDKNELLGLPESALEMAQQTAQQRNVEGWVFTLDFPSYSAVITYADNRALREEMYKAYSTRASDQAANTQFDNSQLMQQILKLRQEEAELLGYNNYAELSLATKMADSPAEVIAFLEDLAQRSKPFAVKEFAQVQAFANTLGIDELQAWDVPYVSEKIRQKDYDFNDEDLKPYFPVDKVLNGLFELLGRLYQVRFEQKNDVNIWHPDVRFYHVYNAQNELQAACYIDLYARQHKRGGAWMDSFCGRFKREDGVQIPVAFMVCNSAPPVGEKPALFTHDEVVTLFHEFGHGLHHMLTQVDYPEIAGINGVEWDAVELPSQFMENWCWERETLDLMTGHWQTGEKLPEALLQKMLAARHFQSAMMMVRQLEFALFDLKLHSAPDAAQEGRIYELLKQVRSEVAVIKYPSYNRMPNSFTHIFAGGYAAGYYSYKWAEVLSADAFARFEEEGLFNPKVGEAFKREILEMGGSRPAMESFIAFRGRKPSIDALLRHSGLQSAA
ncbi:M3 family metallopeptidase [Thiofilum flexile]|uniref:M3 family metallopeptidase n=1 Tax=Thiofilum flexile TaxID=125627 RepID=UPI000360A7E2|nr:M3 family metallopeptidase [Thiofilum flexile]